ncbi:hypothetical protein EJ06DRAFT_532157 [Trichodelitschia bisporula]|uniref:Uncharacterized protein n=1 Tax=Trichodelitschia bisporula TaxID=703511 RepID=A0A6G1HR59_9PEZI|nr:hypothetical protein EJ06DRAFT_532157 [Trichodelitschia bisporula]
MELSIEDAVEMKLSADADASELSVEEAEARATSAVEVGAETSPVGVAVATPDSAAAALPLFNAVRAVSSARALVRVAELSPSRATPASSEPLPELGVTVSVALAVTRTVERAAFFSCGLLVWDFGEVKATYGSGCGCCCDCCGECDERNCGC